MPITLEAREALRSVYLAIATRDKHRQDIAELEGKVKEADGRIDQHQEELAKLLPRPANRNVRYVICDGHLFQLMYRAYMSDREPSVVVTQMPLD